MSMPISGSEAARLFDIPGEILQMIFREAFKNLRLDCKYRPSTRMVMVAYPSCLRVSKKYFAEARIPLLREATIDLHDDIIPGLSIASRSQKSPVRSSHFSPDFALIQHLRATIMPSYLDTAAWRYAMRATPRLRALTLFYEFAIQLLRGPEWSTVKLTDYGRTIIKNEMQESICRWLKIAPWNDLIQQCFERHEDLEFFIERKVIGHHHTEDKHGYRHFHISTAILSTRTWELEVMPGKDNHLSDKSVPEFTVRLDPAVAKKWVEKFGR
ncbi:uncharacterized protein AB675_7285 [Cyphellophora attinorum]|uniref:Uncharacterized protein n=1 Tax=Cyphellophora attinorum TaxID=1664694 RepID=A0A0N1H3M2_9EURO|nr:uncharacterized protein AB675_7285 [Phialophora attinorum]KPI36295.1 hypothetical protein AB675_7285 [Phialophora attinorum]